MTPEHLSSTPSLWATLHYHQFIPHTEAQTHTQRHKHTHTHRHIQKHIHTQYVSVLHTTIIDRSPTLLQVGEEEKERHLCVARTI